MRPKVSVIIPTHNRSQFLNEAIGSVLAQSYQDWELIVVDDHSEDSTQTVVKRYAACDPRIRYLRSAGRGASMTRNTGIRVAQGELIAFLDDDDLWLPEKIELQLKRLLKDERLGLICSEAIVRHPDGHENGRKPAQWFEETWRSLLQQNFIITSTAVVRRRCLNEVGLFDERLPRAEDYDMWLRLTKRFPFSAIRKPLATYRLHEKNTTAQVGVLNYECHVRIFQKLSENPDLPAKYRMLVKHRLARELYLLGKACLLENRAVEAFQGFRQALMTNPCIGLAFAEEADRLDQRIWKAMKPYLAVGYTWLRSFSV